MKKITQEQIKQLLVTFYNTNIPAKDFDAVQKFLNELPLVEEPKTPEAKPTESNEPSK